MSDPSAETGAQQDPDPLATAGADLFAIALERDPHSRWAEIRRAHPILDAGEGVFFVSDWACVDSILRDPRHTAGTGVADSFGASEGLGSQVMRSWLMSLDGKEQTRARGLVRREFSPRRVAELEPQIMAASERLIRAIEEGPAQEETDLIARLAFALPSEIIRSLFGWSEEAWRVEIEAIIRAVDDRPGASLEMIEGLARHFQEKLAADEVPSGLLSALRVPDEVLGALSSQEVVANAVLLVTAAIDTTAGLIGNAIHCLLDRPNLVSAIRDDPTLIPAIVEETLRFESPALSCSRRAGHTFELAGVSIPKGSQLLLGLAAANRDPARYPDPDSFQIDRNFQGLLSFGGGRHVCLGAALARLEARVVLERLFVKTAFDLRRSEPARWQKKNPTVRALDRLPVTLHPRTREEAACR